MSKKEWKVTRRDYSIAQIVAKLDELFRGTLPEWVAPGGITI